MTVTKGTPVSKAQRVTDKAVQLQAQLIENDITRFRFRFGGSFILISVIIFFAGHLTLITKYFTADFPGHAWTMTQWMLVMGGAFSGKEVIESLIKAGKSFVRK